jgi:hypothetical protein
MRSPALAMAWELWGKNRAGIIASLAVLGVGSVPSAMLSARTVEDIWLPLSAAVFMVQYLYLIAIFTYPEFLLRNPSAGFSMRKFTLPVSTTALVTWHMLLSCVGLILLWMATYLLIWLPARIEPAWWVLPPLAAALVWMQVICWSIPRSWLLQLLAMFVTFPALSFCFKQTAQSITTSYVSLTNSLALWRVTEFSVNLGVFSIFSAFAIAAGYVVAVIGVMRVRRGETGLILWHSMRAPRAQEVQTEPWTNSLSELAQFKFELRRKGSLFLLISAIGYLVFVMMVTSPFRNASALTFSLLLIAALFLVTAFCVGYGLGKPNFWGDLGIGSWDATKPVSSGFIAIAKIKAAAAISLGACTVLLVAVPTWFWLEAGWTGIASIPEEVREQLSYSQLLSIGPAIFLPLVAITWGQITAGLCLALTGRGWIVNTVALSTIGMVITFLTSWKSFSEDAAATPILWTFWTCVCGLLVGAKITGAAWCLTSGLNRGLVRWKEIRPYLFLWCLAAMCTIAAAHFGLPCFWENPIHWSVGLSPIPPVLCTLLAILALPLLRLTAAPLAVALSRHG